MAVPTWIKALLISIWAILLPIHAILGAMITMIILDTILGIWCAIKNKEPVTSSKMRRAVSKTLIYLAAILSGFLCEQYLLSGFIPVTKLLASVIGLVEMKSILENLNILNGSPLFESIVKKLGSKNE